MSGPYNYRGIQARSVRPEPGVEQTRDAPARDEGFGKDLQAAMQSQSKIDNRTQTGPMVLLPGNALKVWPTLVNEIGEDDELMGVTVQTSLLTGAVAMIWLRSKSSPTTISILGCRPEVDSIWGTPGAIYCRQHEHGNRTRKVFSADDVGKKAAKGLCAKLALV